MDLQKKNQWSNIEYAIASIALFIKLDKIENFYNIKKKFKENKYKSFFSYFKRIRLGTSIPKVLWNYSNLLEKNNNFEKFTFTNNTSEILIDI